MPGLSTCPKCSYQRREMDSSVHEDVCPSCGIVYSKWLARKALEAEPESPPDPRIVVEEESPSLLRRLGEAFFYVPRRVPSAIIWTRAAVLALFAIWGGYFVVSGLDWMVIGSSFMHNINLPFHEFGHILFSPFGRFMTILGGSLFQIMVPLILLLAFVYQKHDTFAASLMLWWCGQNFIDLSPYIADAQFRGLPLVGGGGEESHDWGNLLRMMDLLDSSHAIARGSFLLGAGIMVLAIVWGAWILRQQKTLQ